MPIKEIQVNVRLKEIKKCRVSKSKKNFISHFCKFCKNSDHFQKDCIFYHGTTKDCVEAIQRSNFLPSKFCRLERGIYFTDIKQSSFKIAKHQSTQHRNAKEKRSVKIKTKILKRDCYHKQKIQHY